MRGSEHSTGPTSALGLTCWASQLRLCGVNDSQCVLGQALEGPKSAASPQQRVSCEARTCRMEADGCLRPSHAGEFRPRRLETQHRHRGQDIPWSSAPRTSCAERPLGEATYPSPPVEASARPIPAESWAPLPARLRTRSGGWGHAKLLRRFLRFCLRT